MTFFFFDTSALVKHYHQEIGSEIVDDIFQDEDAVLLISGLAIVEVASMLSRKRNRGEITDAAMQHALAQFARDVLQELIVLGFQSGFIQQARDLIVQHRNLRTLDSLQLSAVLHVRSLDPTFVCADNQLAEVARAVGLTVINPEAA
jgi:predicted nucleic acid-binding protein